MGTQKPSKKKIMIDLFKTRQGERLGALDLRAAKEELRRRLGAEDRTSLGYVASVLREAGHSVDYDDKYSDPVMPEPYAARLKGVLEFHDLASAEASLLKLGEIFADYSRTLDRAGMRFVQALVRKGKMRAQTIAANP